MAKHAKAVVAHPLQERKQGAHLPFLTVSGYTGKNV